MNKPSDSIKTVPSDEEDDPFAQPNIALMFELEELKVARRTRQIKTAVLLFSCIVLLAIGVYAWVRYREDPVVPIPDGPASTVPTITAKEIREKSESGYIQKIISVKGPAGAEILVNLYDFDANRFMQGEALVDDPKELKRTLVEKSEELKKSLTIIFAGASFEGEPGENRTLCRRRGCYVGKVALEIPDVAPEKLWMIAAGEYKPPSPAGPDDEKTEETVKASPNGARVLRGQRKLFLITIPDAAVGTTNGNASEVVKTVVEALRGGRFVPTEYDHGQSEPTPFANMRCDLLTP